jgi:hypothetical protein
MMALPEDDSPITFAELLANVVRGNEPPPPADGTPAAADD